jgi:ADP-dependent phosphofructokinase/glucokinase
LFITCFEIVAKNKNILFKFTFSIYNQQLPFTLAIPSSPYTNNDDNNGNITPTLKRIFEFSNGIHVKKHGNQFKFKNSD